ncbi:MAG: dipeptidase PepE, partial [Marinirhabdus sp.]|nr:dipeptidase PepE [Marinirhabdus sp.]
MKNLVLASTSTLHSSGYLHYLLPELKALFADTDEIIFIPYARPGGISHDAYTAKAAETFESIGKKLIGLHTFDDPVSAIRSAQGIFTGGGNTFVLVDALHRKELMQPLRERLLQSVPYLGTSAGSNICGPSMHTTNDMPIVYPPSFKTL